MKFSEYVKDETSRKIFEFFINLNKLDLKFINLNNVTSDDILKHQEINWDWGHVSKKITLKQFLEYPNLPWDLRSISSSMDIDFNHILEHPEINWDIQYFQYNLNFKLEDVMNNSELDWDWEYISDHEELTESNVMAHLDKNWDWNRLSYMNFKDISIFHDKPCDWNKICLFSTFNIDDPLLDLVRNVNWDSISLNRNILFQTVIENMSKPWNWRIISYKKDLDFNFVMNNLNLDWNWIFISNNIKNIQEILKFPNGKWDWDVLSLIIPFKEITEHLHLPWNWAKITCNKTVSTSDIIKYSNESWNWSALSYNNIELVILFPDKNWNWFLVSKSKVLFDDVVNHPNLPWDLNILSSKKYFKMSQILMTNFPWNWNFVMSNCIIDIDPNKIPNVNWKILTSNHSLTNQMILENLDKDWDYNALSMKDLLFNVILGLKDKPLLWNWIYAGMFKLQKELIFEECRKKWRAVNLIKKNYLIAFWNVDYNLGRKRCLRSSENENYSVW